MLKSRTQLTLLYKGKVHANIDGNEQAHKLAKDGTKKDHMNLYILHHFTYKKNHGLD